MGRPSWRAGIAVLLGLLGWGGMARAKSGKASGPPWWQQAVFYEIYPRSFADSNDDGVGDLRGIAGKLGYLRELGIDAIWITPCFPSPQVDFGYDVSDYQAIDPSYGTLADFDALVAQGKQLGIRVILDLVVNHTSDQHPWFLDARSARDAAHRDWYIWRDGRSPGRPPNQWLSVFGGPAWTFDGKTRQYYYHYFYAQQPDLNWRNPAVEAAMLDVTRWWYRRGVAGFRLDAVDTLFESPRLEDNAVLSAVNALGDPVHIEKYNKNLPEVHDVLKKLRAVADESDSVLIGETWTRSVDELRRYYGEGGNELQLPMDLMFATLNTVDAVAFRRHLAAIERAGIWPVYLIGNHDLRRSYDRYGDGRNNDAIAKLMGAFYLTLRGSPILYYGEEIGIAQSDPVRQQDVKDPIGRRGWPKEKGRDGGRTPMQWSGKPHAGFSTVPPWLPVSPNYVTHNVARETTDPDSILSVYRRVLALRREHSALREGRYRALNENDAHVLSYLRLHRDRAVLVALNMSDRPRTASFKLSQQGLRQGRWRALLVTQGSTVAGTTVALGPFGVLVAEVPGPRPARAARVR